MSLFLGNLSPRIRRDDIEREFRRFGRCTIQLKDGYGFIIYDLPANAEKALRVLRGKNISGQPISLRWANKQPKPFQRFRRGSRFSEPNNSRNFSRRKVFEMRKEGSDHQKDSEGVNMQPDGEGVGPHIGDMLEKDIGNCHDDDVDQEGEKHHNPEEDLLDAGISVGPNVEDSGRWGELVSGPLDDKEAEDEANFDRYEPYHGYDVSDYDHHRTSSHGTPARGSSREKSQRACIVDTAKKKLANSDPQPKCYGCGLIGHKMRNCPRGDAHRKEKFIRFDRHRDKEINFRVSGKREQRRPGPASRGSYSDFIGSLPLSRKHKRDRKSSGIPQKLVREERSPTDKETRRSQLRGNSQRKKKRNKEDGDPPKYGCKAKRFRLSPHSDSNASSLRLRSRSPGTSSSSRSSSRSVSSRTQSSRSRSMSPSSRSRSESSRSRSKSNSSTSLSALLGRPLPSSQDKAQMEGTGVSSKNYLEKDGSPKSKQLIDRKQITEGDLNSGNLKLKCTNATPSDVNGSPSVTVEVDKKNHSGHCNDGKHSPKIIEYELRSSCGIPKKASSACEDLPSENLGKQRDHEKSRSQVMEDTRAPSEKQISEVPDVSRSENLTSISSQEMYAVLKHYGLPVPKDRENLPVEAYFGSARLWPWEIIFYRRLKKGLISTENYASRIAQNEEFGIVDKYIRSSSGWYE